MMLMIAFRYVAATIVTSVMMAHRASSASASFLSKGVTPPVHPGSRGPPERATPLVVVGEATEVAPNAPNRSGEVFDGLVLFLFGGITVDVNSLQILSSISVSYWSQMSKRGGQ